MPAINRQEVLSAVAVVIPSYKVRAHVVDVIQRIGPEVVSIYVVDDACPEYSGKYVEDNVTDPRVRVLYNAKNLGVGGATKAGMKMAIIDGADIIVKVDGDGQMDPAHIPSFVGIIQSGEADYTKGNRFFELSGLSSMPVSRLLGNAGLSFLAKFSTGYWNSFDPTNGFVAIHAAVLDLLPLDKISDRYFFESDMLFRLNLAGARVVDIPMRAHYAQETSGLKPHREILRFGAAHFGNFCKRVFYSYFLRDFSVASVELFIGTLLCLFGAVYGIANWGSTRAATAGTVMTAALPIIVGTQFLLAFLSFDIQSTPRITLHLRLRGSARPRRVLEHRDSGA